MEVKSYKAAPKRTQMLRNGKVVFLAILDLCHNLPLLIQLAPLQGMLIHVALDMVCLRATPVAMLSSVVAAVTVTESHNGTQRLKG
eukprot:448808-Pelagomonas_calceolata.AAC.1